MSTDRSELLLVINKNRMIILALSKFLGGSRYYINCKITINLGTSDKPLYMDSLKKETCLSGLKQKDGASVFQQIVTEQVGEVPESAN